MNPAWKEAALGGDVRRLDSLGGRGEDLDQLDRYGQSALMLCARQGQVSTVRWLIAAGADLDRSAKYGLTAAMLAAINGHDDVVALLAEAGADMSKRGIGAAGFEGKTVADLRRLRDELRDALEGDRQTTG